MNGDWSKVNKPVMVLIIYGSNDHEEVEKGLTINEHDNNYHNVVSNSDSDNEVKENVFEEHVDDKVGVTPKTTLSSKVKCAKKFKLCITKMPTK